MARTKYSIILLAAAIALFGAVERGLAHGGEDHGDEQKAPAISVGQSNTILAAAENLEILLKYPTPKPEEELHIQVFITDLKTNAPVTGLSASMTFNSANNSGKPIEVSAVPADAPGIYQAHVVFPTTGRYNLAIKLSGGNANVQTAIEGFEVPDKATMKAEQSGSYEIPTAAVAALALFAAAAIAGYLFLYRPRRNEQSGADAQGHTA